MCSTIVAEFSVAGNQKGTKGVYIANNLASSQSVIYE